MYLAETPLVTPGRTPDPAAPAALEPPEQWHRVLTLLCAVSLFIGTRTIWTQAASHRLVVAAVISLCYVSILVCGVLAPTVRLGRSLARVDLCLLLTAVTLVLCAWVMNPHGNDEAVLTAQAARAIVDGDPVYGQPWPWLFGHGIALTPTMHGGYDYTYGYPPLAPLLTAPLLWIGPDGVPATAMGTGALVVGAVTMWRMLPAPWRPTATMVCLGFSFLPMFGRQGYPAIVALALLIPVVVRWPRIGRGGRLGGAGIARAACLGAACAAQQLPWFVTPFLLAGLYAVRRGELGPRAAAGVLLRVAGVAVTVWLLINAYFVVREPRNWLGGIVLPLTQDAIIHGQGLVGVSLYYTDGSDRLEWYGHASKLLLVGLLVLYVLFVRRLGPAATVLPWFAFFLATRSQDGYYQLMTPLWLAAAVTAPLSEFAGAWQPRPRPLAGAHRRPARIAAAVLVVVPALASATAGATGTPPLDMRLASVRRASSTAVSLLAVRVENTGDDALAPHFTLTTGQGFSPYWTIEKGPRTLSAHTTAVYEIRPPSGKFRFPRAGVRVRLRAFTGAPQTLSSTDVTKALRAPLN
ncbi:hypothetical protein [Streptomyces sp. NPDC051677]|uniref:hypothetical protein n=1 Tax=Streptomyces sp. NPDC051677 TaxID=3365669 RepID=UPI0037CDE332